MDPCYIIKWARTYLKQSKRSHTNECNKIERAKTEAAHIYINAHINEEKAMMFMLE